MKPRPKQLNQGQLDLIFRAPAIRTEPPEGYVWQPAPFAVVIPYYNKDAELLLNMLDLCLDLEPKGHLNKCYLVTNDETGVPIHREVIRRLQKIFPNTEELFYKNAILQWPHNLNHAFVETMRAVAAANTDKHPLLWLEPDMAPAKPGWLKALEEEYNKAKRPFMGPWVETYDLMNGAGVHPHNVVDWMPSLFMGKPMQPWDCEMTQFMMWHLHPVNHMMPHFWFTNTNGRPSLLAGDVPVWTEQLLNWTLTHNTCLIHRCKTGKLVSLLRERLTKNT